MDYIIGAFIIYTTYYTFKIGKDLWENNKFGSIGVFVLALSIIGIPLYRFLFKI